VIIAGIMTGTSVDAIDVAICDITAQGDRHTVSLIHYVQAPYPPDLSELIHKALKQEASMEELSDLPFALAQAYAEVVKGALAHAGRPAQAVGVHGQTLWHHPPHSTWQAVSAPALAALLDLPVVSDFRSADVAAGGQGAPLVPVFDFALLAGPVSRVAVNIGGMANITLLPADATREMVTAFDCGPGNILIDAVCERCFGKHFDTNGAIAAAGVVLDRVVRELQQHPFFAEHPPKSTGREVFGTALADALVRKYAHPSIPSEDLVRSVTNVTAWCIADHIIRFQPDTREVIVSGGGVHNATLMSTLCGLLPECSVESSASYGIDPDAKEAMAFAYLAWLSINGLPGNLPTVTGARSSVVLGSLSPPQSFRIP